MDTILLILYIVCGVFFHPCFHFTINFRAHRTGEPCACVFGACGCVHTNICIICSSHIIICFCYLLDIILQKFLCNFVVYVVYTYISCVCVYVHDVSTVMCANACDKISTEHIIIQSITI